jgi:oxygen-independent coproporphyrinogen-3 oxidase
LSGPDTPLGLYLHVPFCAQRCGYCDFNTYTPAELDNPLNALVNGYLEAVAGELAQAAATLAGPTGPGRRPLATVFIGGGTPTVLSATQLSRLIATIRAEFDLVPGAEVTMEANPESLDEAKLAVFLAGGGTRVSMGMQSADPTTLRILERGHDPARIGLAASWIRAAGLELSLDLIYGTPGEDAASWRRSLESALATDADHLSCYALGIEPGTRMGAARRRGLIQPVTDEVMAERYEAADDLLTAAGLEWYEISNWARGPERRCRHNLGYWLGHDWWGAGPGAHSHVAGRRWWNVRAPRTYSERIAAGLSPEDGAETIGPVEALTERIMLRLRLDTGLEIADLPVQSRLQVPELVAGGLLATGPAAAGTLIPTRRGRLLADLITARLLP